MLSDPQIDRYSRQILLPRFGGRGQERLLAARVAILGTGPAIQIATTYLAAAGIGAIDVYADIDLSPTEYRTNPDCRITRHSRVGTEAVSLVVLEWVEGSFDSPLLEPLLADAHSPWVFARARAGTATVVYTGAECARCALQEFDAWDRSVHTDAGTHASAEGVAGTLLALEAIEWLAGTRESNLARRTDFDLRCGEVTTAQLVLRCGCGHIGSGGL